jgi:2-polyprenyl-6-methoxyphenol hydroxylase-like FAD-dependent oxidoreductase
MTARTILISGASIAGPAFAYWANRYGFETTIVEQAPAPRPGGQAVDIRGAAKAVIGEMGLTEQVHGSRVEERGLVFVDGRGRPRARMPADLFGGEGIVAEIEILRGDLARILQDVTRTTTEYILGDRIESLDQSSEGVDITFASGQRRPFDLVIGTDGLHSGVRALAFGPEENYLHHLGGYTSYFTVPDPGDLDHWFEMYNAPGGRVVGLRPEPGGTAKAMLSFTSAELVYPRGDLRRQREIVMAAFAGAGGRAESLLAAMEQAADFYFDAICQVHLKRWWRGRVAVLGDAGFCSSHLTGLGTSAALLGAYVLAGELAATPADHEGAYARYQAEMRSYVGAAQTLPPGGMRGFAPQSAVMIGLRNLSMRMATKWPMRAAMAKQFAKSDGITLKHYGARVG